MKTIQLSSFTVSYQQGGQGRPLVFLHAFPLSSAMWRRQLERLSPHFEVLAPNFRGIDGTSEFEAEPSITTLAHDLALWLEAMRVEPKITLCGLSMGGYVALEFAHLYPDKLQALILADTRADADSADAKGARDEMIEFARSHDGRAVAQRMMPKLLGETTLRRNPSMVQLVEEMAASNSGEALARLVAAMRDRGDSTEVLPLMAVPTLVIGGAEDVVSPAEVMAQMAAQIPNSQHIVIENAGHLSNLEQPDHFNAALRAFLLSI